MKMASRTSGSKVVALAVGAIVAALGIGTIWAPFYADRDKLRGMNEDADGGMSSRKRRLQERGEEAAKKENMSKTNSNSMWARMNQQASPSDKK